MTPEKSRPLLTHCPMLDAHARHLNMRMQPLRKDVLAARCAVHLFAAPPTCSILRYHILIGSPKYEITLN